MLHHLSRAPQLEQNDCPFAQSKGFPRRRPIRPGLMFSCNIRTKGVTKRPVAKSALRGESRILRYPYARNDSQRVILQRPLPDLRLILKARSPHRWSGSPAWPWDVDGPNGQRKRYLPIHRNQTGPALAEESGVSEGTVRTARKSTAHDYAADNEPRVGLDGKQRRMPVRQPVRQLRHMTQLTMKPG